MSIEAVSGKNGGKKAVLNLPVSGKNAPEKRSDKHALAKAPTGIDGFDDITHGGLPRGRATLVCGGPGCGKTLFAMEFLVHGANSFDEPGVFFAFEESTRELAENTNSLGFDLRRLSDKKKLIIEHIRVDRGQFTETGAFDLEGLFIRLGHAIDTIGARRVVLDTIEILFGGLPNPAILRSEIHRLFQWLKERGVTAIVTAEQGDGHLTRDGLEEYVSDCVIVLDHRVLDQISTRRLRVVKYRGSWHGTNEFPFLILDSGISVMPISALGLDHGAPVEHVSTGVPALDAMFDGGGLFRGSTALVSGSAGSGKSTLAAHFAKISSQPGKRCIYFAFEESSAQIIRNMRSIGLDLEPERDAGRLIFHSCRPTAHSLELHLVLMHRLIDQFRPDAVIVDPISNLTTVAPTTAVRSMLTRLIDNLKTLEVTAFFTSFTPGNSPSLEMTDLAVSSLVDTWLIVRDLESDGERTRGLSILKSRGMAHSNQVREFRMTDRGVELIDVYLGPEGMLTGAARIARQARERAEAALRGQDLDRRRRVFERRKATLDSQIAAMRLELEDATKELDVEIAGEQLRESIRASDRVEMSRARSVEIASKKPLSRNDAQTRKST